MLIIDAHLDLAWNALQWNRDLQTSVYTIRARESQLTGAGRGQGTVALPDMRTGRVALCFATLLARSTGRSIQNLDYSSSLQAYGIAQGQLAYYYGLEKAGEVQIIKTARQLEDHMIAWEEWEINTTLPQPEPGLVISMESADPIQSPQDLAEWKDAGVRVIGPAHYGPGRYAGGTSTELGLTALGKELLREMDGLGIILDLTHLSDKAFWEAMDRFDGAVLASHNNCRALVPHQRQFDDRQIRAIIERDGVIGSACDNWMLRFGWVRGAKDNEPVHLLDVANHIDHICQLAGDSQHAGIGSDLDGGFGREQSPADLDTIADLQNLAELLTGRGYHQDDVASITHGNWLRFLQRAWSQHSNEGEPAMSKQQITTRAGASPIGAYSQGLRVGDFIFVSGQGPLDPETGQIVGTTVEEQTARVLENIKAILAAGSATMADVVKVTAHLSDLSLFERYNNVYATYFPDPRPTRTTVGSQLLGILVEIDAIAYVGEK